MRVLANGERVLRNCRDCIHVRRFDEKNRVYIPDQEGGNAKKSSIYACAFKKCPYEELDNLESKHEYYDSLQTQYSKKLLRDLGRRD